MRYLFLLLLATVPVTAYACTCTSNFIPLRERLCTADTSGQYVVELVFERRLPDLGNAVEVRVVRQHFGPKPPVDAEGRMTVGANHSCAWWVREEHVSGRFLYFGWADSRRGDVDGDLFEACGHANIYPMNDRGTEIAYPTADGEPWQRTVDVFRKARGATDLCGPAGPAFPLDDLELINSLSGTRRVALTTSDVAIPLPPLQSLTVHLADGRTVGNQDLRAYVPGEWIDLGNAPKGLLFLMVSDGIRRRTFRVVVP